MKSLKRWKCVRREILIQLWEIKTPQHYCPNIKGRVREAHNECPPSPQNCSTLSQATHRTWCEYSSWNSSPKTKEGSDLQRDLHMSYPALSQISSLAGIMWMCQELQSFKHYKTIMMSCFKTSFLVFSLFVGFLLSVSLQNYSRSDFLKMGL